MFPESRRRKIYRAIGETGEGGFWNRVVAFAMFKIRFFSLQGDEDGVEWDDYIEQSREEKVEGGRTECPEYL